MGSDQKAARRFAWLRQCQEPVPADLHRAWGAEAIRAPGVSPYQLKAPAFPNKHHLCCRHRGQFKENKKKPTTKKTPKNPKGGDKRGVSMQTGFPKGWECPAAAGTGSTGSPGAERAPAAPRCGGGVHRYPLGTVPVPAAPALPSFLIPTRKHFFRRQYWHWLRWCWSIWQSRLDLRTGPGR